MTRRTIGILAALIACSALTIPVRVAARESANPLHFANSADDVATTTRILYYPDPVHTLTSYGFTAQVTPIPSSGLAVDE